MRRIRKLVSRLPIRSQLLWRWVPGTILAVVASTQVTLAFTADLTPWKGGGFGMFANIDGGSDRRFLFEGKDEQGDIHPLVVEFSRSRNGDQFAKDVGRRLRAMPDWKQIQTLADELLRRDFEREKSGKYQRFLKDVADGEYRGEIDFHSPADLAERVYRLKRREKKREAKGQEGAAAKADTVADSDRTDKGKLDVVDKDADDEQSDTPEEGVEIDDDEAEEPETIRFKAIRVSLWKINYEPESGKLSWGRIGNPVYAGEWK